MLLFGRKRQRIAQLLGKVKILRLQRSMQPDWLRAWQTEVGGLSADGIFGAKSKAAAASHMIKKGSCGILVTLWQAYLVCCGYDPKGIDGIFGAGCRKATIAFQNAAGLTPDGIVGPDTWYGAFHG